jgi:hypothetical protein
MRSREPTFKERLLFTLLSAAMLGLAKLAADRLSHAAWRRATGRPPPKHLALAHPAAEKAARSAAEGVLGLLPFGA